ncbi:MAG: endonuclease domain-containing protein [Candidatus Tritonobacter lacicola]|nr:endonuclease domain-containing protein [Candidatus Tritonobacter lacicola]
MPKARKRLTPLARKLRKNSTDAERLLWSRLRAKQIEGLKFRQQQPIGNYIVDFVCFKKRIIVEADGGQHSKERDAERDHWLGEQGFTTLRFWDNDILTNIHGVLEVIRSHCLKTPPPAKDIAIWQVKSIFIMIDDMDILDDNMFSDLGG